MENINSKLSEIYSARARLSELLNADRSGPNPKGRGLNAEPKPEIRGLIARLRKLGDYDYIEELAREYMV